MAEPVAVPTPSVGLDELGPLWATAALYQDQHGWLVRVDESAEQVLLLAGQTAHGTGRIGAAVSMRPASRIVVVDLPSGTGSAVHAALRRRGYRPPVMAIFTKQLRWRLVAQADADPPSVRLLDVSVLDRHPVPLPHRLAPSVDGCRRLDLARLSTPIWIAAPAAGARLPSLDAVLSAVSRRAVVGASEPAR